MLRDLPRSDVPLVQREKGLGRRKSCRWKWLIDCLLLDSMSARRFVWTVACKMTLFPTLKASTHAMIFLFFFVCHGFADYRKVHSIIIPGWETRTRGLCSISLTAPVLIVGVCIPPWVAPDPTGILLRLRVLASVSSRSASSILRV